MALNPELVKTLLDDAIQELAEINERKSHLDALVANLRKCLKNSSKGNLLAQEPTATRQVFKKGGYRRKSSHATKIYEIITHSETKMKARDVLQAYRERGLRISEKRQNALTSIYRAIKERPDLFTLKDGYILPVSQQ